MRNLWVIAVLFVVRLTWLSSFKALPRSHRYWVASSALVSLFGILIGLYFTPGLALASPGGAIGRRWRQDHGTGALILMLMGTLWDGAFGFLNQLAESGVNAPPSRNRC